MLWLQSYGSRLLQMVVTVIGVSFLTFCLTWLAPGDPASMLLEASDTIVSEETLAQTRHELGLDKPFLVQYGNWAAGVLQGDMGMSYSAKKPVTAKLLEGFKGTLLLAFVTMVLVVLISLPLGILSAVKRNRLPDHLVRGGVLYRCIDAKFLAGIVAAICIRFEAAPVSHCAVGSHGGGNRVACFDTGNLYVIEIHAAGPYGGIGRTESRLCHGNQGSGIVGDGNPLETCPAQCDVAIDHVVGDVDGVAARRCSRSRNRVFMAGDRQHGGAGYHDA